MVESLGLFFIFIVISLSNAGGLSGAGINVPLLMVFFELEMIEAVPISAFIGIVATSLRFIINYN